MAQCALLAALLLLATFPAFASVGDVAAEGRGQFLSAQQVAGVQEGSTEAVLAPQVALAGEEVGLVEAQSAAACAALCANSSGCEFFNHCSSTLGCSDLGLEAGQCSLLAANASGGGGGGYSVMAAVPRVQAQGAGMAAVTAGFPLRHPQLLRRSFPGFSTAPWCVPGAWAQGEGRERGERERERGRGRESATAGTCYYTPCLPALPPSRAPASLLAPLLAPQDRHDWL